MVTRSLEPNNQTLVLQLWGVKYKSIDENLCRIDWGFDCSMWNPLNIHLRSGVRTNMTLCTQKHWCDESRRALILVLTPLQPIPKAKQKILKKASDYMSISSTVHSEGLVLILSNGSSVWASERGAALLNISKGGENQWDPNTDSSSSSTL